MYHHLSTYIIGAAALLLAVETVSPPSLAIGLSTPATSFVSRFDAASSHGGALQTVDRSGKGSRLVPSKPESDSNGSAVEKSDRNVGPASDAKPAKTPNGCDAAYSPLVRNGPTQFVGRCIA